MKVVHYEQGSQPWLDWRLGGVGSSDAMAIAAHHGLIEKQPWMRSLSDLYEEKMTGISHVVVNARMIRGTENEPDARRAAEKRTGIIFQPLCAEMDQYNGIRASFDGITLSMVKTLELKCPKDEVHALAKKGTIMEYYVPQVVHQSLVACGPPEGWTDTMLIHFGSFVPETGDFALVVKPATEFREFATKLLAAELEFLQCVETGVPPCGFEYEALAQRYLVVDLEIKRLKASLALYKSGMEDVAKRRKVDHLDGGGVSLKRTERAGLVDWKRLAAENNISRAAQEDYRGAPSTYWRATPDPNATVPAASPDSMQATLAGDAKAAIQATKDEFWDQFDKAPSTPKAAHATNAG